VLEAFLASLGDYGEEEYLLQVEVVIKFLLDNVSKSNKISKEVKHIAAATAFRVLTKGYALTPPKPLSNTKIWGNYAIHHACSKYCNIDMSSDVNSFQGSRSLSGQEASNSVTGALHQI
jgi:hypothetical protein